MKFNELMKKLREDRNLTQQQAAELIGVSINTIQNWEKDSKPEYAMLKNISDIYNVDINSLLQAIAYDLSEKENKNKYDFLPDCIKDFSLSHDEQNLLGYLYMLKRIYSRNSSKEIIFNFYKNSFDLIRQYEGLYNKGLCDAQMEITGLGINIVNIMKEHPFDTFDIQKLQFKEILSMFYYCEYEEGSVNRLTSKTSKDINQKLKIFSKGKQPLYNFQEGYYEKIYQYIPYDYYKIVKEESSEPKYVEEKEKYLKKKKFYDENKEFMDMNEPYFNLQFKEYVVPTEKGQSFIDWYNENS